MRTARSFPAEMASVAAARRYAREALAALAPEHRDAAELMVSELATNSVKHANSSFTVVIDRAPAALHVEVHDTGGGNPALASPPPSEPTGRGLRIVELMSTTWGIRESGHGKTVWFTLESAHSASAGAASALGTESPVFAPPPAPPRDDAGPGAGGPRMHRRRPCDQPSARIARGVPRVTSSSPARRRRPRVEQRARAV